MHLRIDKTNDWKIIKNKLQWRKGCENKEALSDVTLHKRLHACREWRQFCKGNNYSCDARISTLLSHLEEYLEPQNKSYIHMDISSHLRRLYECANYADEENPVVLFLQKVKDECSSAEVSCISHENEIKESNETIDSSTEKDLIDKIFGSSSSDECLEVKDISSEENQANGKDAPVFEIPSDHSESHINYENTELNPKETLSPLPCNIEDQDTDKLEALVTLGKIDILKSFLRMPEDKRPNKATLKEYADQIFK